MTAAFTKYFRLFRNLKTWKSCSYQTINRRIHHGNVP